ARGEPATRPRRAKRKRRPPVKRVRTVLASTAGSEAFGWQVAAEVQRRGLHRAGRKGYICDGLQYNWTIFALHFAAWGFIPILNDRARRYDTKKGLKREKVEREWGLPCAKGPRATSPPD